MMKRSATRKAAIAGVLAVCLGGMVGCADPGTGPATASGAPAPDLGTLHVVFGAPLANFPAFAPMGVAQQLGYWSEEGLDVDIKGLDGGAAAIQALVTGRADVSIGSPTVFLPALAAGKPLGTLSFYTWIRGPVLSLAVPEDSPIKTLADLKGKVIGVQSVGQDDTSAIRRVIADATGVAEADIQQVAIGQGAQAIEALKGGHADAYAGGDNSTATLTGSGYAMREIPLPDAIANTTDQTFTTTPKFFDAHKKMLVAWGRGWSKAVAFCHANLDACIKLYWKQYPTAKPAGADSDFETASSMIRAVQEIRLPKYYAADGKWGFQSEEGMPAVAELLGITGLDPDEIKSLYTNELIDEISDFDEAAIETQAKEFTG